VLDASRAAAEWGFVAASAQTYVPRIVRAHLDHPPGSSHEGYAHRPREVEWAERQLASSR
jgi:hypothetical protein